MSIAIAVAFHLVELTGPKHQYVTVNPAEVVSVRQPRAHDHIHSSVKCIVHTTDGKFISVIEDCRTVRRKLEMPY